MLMLDGVGKCTGASIISLISRVVLTGHSLVILNFIDRLINNRINMVCTTFHTMGKLAIIGHVLRHSLLLGKREGD
jgi:hypothetical protein